MKNITILFLLFAVFSCTKAPNIFEDITERGGFVLFETKLNPLHDILGDNDNVVDINLIDPNNNAKSCSVAVLKEDGTLTQSVAETVVPGNLIIKRQAVVDALGLSSAEDLPVNITFVSTVTKTDGTIVSGLQSDFDTTFGVVTGGDTHYDGITGVPNQAMKFKIVMFQLIKPNEEVSFFINDTKDDVEEVVVDFGEPLGTMSLKSSDLELGEISSGDGLMAIGLRFNFIGLPQGANITKAQVQFQTDNTGSNPVEMTIYGENTGDSEPFEDILGNLTSRVLTTSNAVWNIAPWSNVGDRGAAQLTIDFSNVLQEIIDRSDWIPGNSITIILKPTGNTLNVTSSSGGREAEAGLGDDSAEFIIQYN